MRTVETHRAHIQQKLRRTTRAELVRYALEHGPRRRLTRCFSAARAAASPGTPWTAPPGNVAALPMNRPFSGVEYGDSFGIGRKTTWRSR